MEEDVGTWDLLQRPDQPHLNQVNQVQSAAAARVSNSSIPSASDTVLDSSSPPHFTGQHRGGALGRLGTTTGRDSYYFSKRGLQLGRPDYFPFLLIQVDVTRVAIPDRACLRHPVWGC